MPVNMERRALLALGLLWLGGVRAIAAPAAIDVTGLWSAAVRTRGGLGAQMTFTETEATSTFGALVDFKYEISGNLIKMTSMEPRDPQNAEMTQEFKIEGDTMTVTFGNGASQIMTRVGAPHRDAHPIVGDWAYQHQTGVPAVQRFSSKGIMQLSAPFVTYKGPYRIEGETMHIQFAGVPAVAITVQREGNRLTTRDEKGKVIGFVKFEY
jgi:hypothetical protein